MTRMQQATRTPAIHVLPVPGGFIRTPCFVVEAFSPRHALPGARVLVHWPSGRVGRPLCRLLEIARP